MKSIYLLSFLFLTLASCGGSGGSSGSSAGQSTNSSIDPLDIQFGNSITARFIDDPVEGMLVKSLKSGEQSYTGSNGNFSCERGEELEFRFGGVLIGTGFCDHKIFLGELDTAIRKDFAASLIQSFSIKTSTSLEIAPWVTDTQISNVNFTDASSFASTMNSVIATMKAPLTPLQKTLMNYVSPTVAMNKADESIGEHGKMSDSQIDLISSFLEEGEKTITLYTTSRNEGHCIPSLDVTYSIQKKSLGYYVFIISSINSMDDSDSFYATKLMLSSIRSKIYKIVSRPSFITQAKYEFTAAQIGGWLKSKFGDPWITAVMFPLTSFSSYTSEISVKMYPKENASSANLELSYKALRTFYILGTRYEMQSNECSYRLERTL